ncbi:MAG: hypothetical protein EB138_02225 [Actinobacteria bacterium]|nr:hypothetical protein [Actinomycetota bacterium]NDF71779.1 hypothetical protein [Actinomycetota bacterium]
MVRAIARVFTDPATKLCHGGDHDVVPAICEIRPKRGQPSRQITQESAHGTVVHRAVADVQVKIASEIEIDEADSEIALDQRRSILQSCGELGRWVLHRGFTQSCRLELSNGVGSRRGAIRPAGR